MFNHSNSADPDEMYHYAACHLYLHCLPKYPFSGFPSIQRVNSLALLAIADIFINTSCTLI